MLLLLVLAACVHRGVTPIRSHFNKGVYHYSEGDYDAAISEYRLALEEDPGDYRARFNLAETLEVQATRRAEVGAAEPAAALRREAEEHYLAILAVDPDHLRASVNLAARELDRGEKEAAEKRLLQAMQRHPRVALPRIALAAHRLRAADPAQARSALALLEAALDQDPANVDANMLLGYACTALERLGDPDPSLLDRAREAYRRAIDSDPEDLGAMLALARLERRAGRHEQALPWLRRALYVNPDWLEVHLMLSEVLDLAGDLEAATAHLWRSRLLEDPDRPRLAAPEYRRRLLDLYRRLAQRETGSM